MDREHDGDTGKGNVVDETSGGDTPPPQRGLHEMSPLQIKDVDAPDDEIIFVNTRVSCWQRGQGLTVIILLFLIKSLAITITLIVFIYYGEPQLPIQGAVVSDSFQCSQVGRDLLMSDGSAVDAAISTALCLAVIHPHRSGLGGGGLLLLHNHKSQQSEVFDFLETSPRDVRNESLFSDEVVSSGYRSGIAVGVPGMLRAFKELHDKYGRMSWAAVIRPAITLARDGFYVDSDLAKALKAYPDMASQLFDQPPQRVLNPPTRAMNANLARTLRHIELYGIDDFYHGRIARNIIDKVKSSAGVMKLADLSSYSVLHRDVVAVWYDDYRVISTPPPSSGAYLLSVLNLVNIALHNGEATERPTNMNDLLLKLIDAYQGMSHYLTQLGDPRDNADDINAIVDAMTDITSADIEKFGSNLTLNEKVNLYDINTATTLTSSHVITYDNSGVMVSLTSSLGSPFGSQLVTADGIILNNRLQDFSSPRHNPNPNNMVSPGKRPLSLMAPAVLYVPSRLCHNRIVLASGSGIDAVFSTLQTILHLTGKSMLNPRLTNEADVGNLNNANSLPRLRINVMLQNITTADYEEKFDPKFVLKFIPNGKEVSQDIGAVHLLVKYNNTLFTSADPRISGNGGVIAGVAHF